MDERDQINQCYSLLYEETLFRRNQKVPKI